MSGQSFDGWILIRFCKLDGSGGDNIAQCMLRQEGEKTNEKGVL